MHRHTTRRVVRRLFANLDAGDIDALLARCHPQITHAFAGTHALGGTRHGTPACRAWFERLERLFPTLRFDVDNVAVDGPPWNTTAVVRWRDHGVRVDGADYDNRGVHVVRIRWGQATSIDAHLDTARLARALAEMGNQGIDEAVAAPLSNADVGHRAGPRQAITRSPS